MDNVRKGFVAFGYILSLIGFLSSTIISQKVPSISFIWVTAYPYDFGGKVLILVGLILMGLGFLIHRAPQKPRDI